MGKNMMNNIAQEASNWWSDILTGPKFDNGDSSESGLITSVMAHMSAQNISTDDIKNFNKNLYSDILARMNSLHDNLSIIYSCDYGPDANLRHIAEISNIPINNFPWKTTMWIYKDACLVRYGYGADVTYVYDSASYWYRKQKENTESITYWENEGRPDIVQEYMQEGERIKQHLEECLNRETI